MGLPLYRAPVESDIKSKVPKDPPTRARSTIRRSRRLFTGVEHSHTPAARFHAYHQYRNRNHHHQRPARSATPAADPPFPSWLYDLMPDDQNAAQRAALRRAAVLADASTYFHPERDSTIPSLPSATQDVHHVMHDAVRRGVSQETARLYGEHMAMLHAATSGRSSQASDEVTPGERGIALLQPDPYNTYWPTPSTALVQQQQQQQPAVDGLGDRDRSLSPEDDGVWDTLLSSITPDPQTPSVGTSFASTSAPMSSSAATTAQESSGLSEPYLEHAPLTLTTVTVFDPDHACESGGDNTDTEGDEEDESRENTLRRYERSYADVVAHTQLQHDEDDLEIPGDVESMQRIVRTLARREDIPDEWWAEAGLSRSLSREAA
ncbi:hypothetical protein M406DRAFT_353739 [Cryphonectria parasitica EP155]|uniref:Uncharacterized protein n=1 Tax=Cryphonectria parasitica (strain ATCC 38755 / EP155) TaxID=660469 RepID=A0A9P5CJB3_CRYP1|nr:uncharacterized protein M406DRAFT_353739 [Cryphonectria parasitica EP155]KAF3761164.1 hypothetical protein M406DRAFT_353739 [Cryphonectria parasitica EP155]